MATPDEDYWTGSLPCSPLLRGALSTPRPLHFWGVAGATTGRLTPKQIDEDPGYPPIVSVRFTSFRPLHYWSSNAGSIVGPPLPVDDDLQVDVRIQRPPRPLHFWGTHGPGGQQSQPPATAPGDADGIIWLSVGDRLNAQPLASDDDFPFVIDDDFGAPRLFALTVPLSAQPLSDDDGAQLGNLPVDDDLTPTLIALPWQALPQPRTDDETGAQLAQISLDDDQVQPVLISLPAQALLQPATDDEIGAGLAKFWLDDDLTPTLLSLPAQSLAQPATDDEIGARLKNFGLDDDIGPIADAMQRFIARQPIAIEEDPPALIIYVDDDGALLLTAQPASISRQPPTDDETRVVVCDEDGQLSVNVRLASFRPLHYWSNAAGYGRTKAALDEDNGTPASGPATIRAAQLLALYDADELPFVVDEDGFILGTIAIGGRIVQPATDEEALARLGLDDELQSSGFSLRATYSPQPLTDDELIARLGFDDEPRMIAASLIVYLARQPAMDDEALPGRALDEDAQRIATLAVAVYAVQPIAVEEIIARFGIDEDAQSATSPAPWYALQPIAYDDMFVPGPLAFHRGEIIDLPDWPKRLTVKPEDFRITVIVNDRRFTLKPKPRS